MYKKAQREHEHPREPLEKCKCCCYRQVSTSLQDEALVLLRAGGLAEECGTGCVLENLTDTLVGLGRALEVLVGTDLLADLLSLLFVSISFCTVGRMAGEAVA